MNVQDTTNQLDEAKKIWDQLDAEDEGRAQPSLEAEQNPPADPQLSAEPTDPAPAEHHNDVPADAPKGGEEAAPKSEQALLDKIAGLESMLTQVTQRLRNAEGHIGGLGNQLKQQQQVAAQVTAAGGDAPSATEIRKAQSDPQAMAALKRDYPEFAEAMESALKEQVQALRQELVRQQPNQPQVTHEEIAKLRSEMAVEVVHPGWQGRVRTPEFVGWLQRQAREVQLLAASESPQDAIRLLDLHSEATKAATSQRTQRLNSAAAIPSGRSGGNTRQKAVEDMSPEEYWRYLDELDRQKKGN